MIFLRVALLAVLVLPSLSMASPKLSEYELVFSDEFNSITLDTTKWGSTHLWGPYADINGEKQYYVDTLDADAGHPYNPFILNGSTLRIQAVPTTNTLSASEQPDQNDPYWLDRPEYHYNPDYDPAEREYLSGILSTVNDFNFTHGYAEAKIKLPAGQGLWSAFWLLTSKYVENAPEIDIMEALGHKKDTVHHTMHYFDIQNNWASISTPTYDTTGTDFTEDFHVYGVSWSPKKLTWYVDGEPVKTITDDDYTIPTQSMYVLLNLAVGGTWPGNPDSTTPFPSSMEVDYVRTYRKKLPATITPAVLQTDYQLMFEDNFDGNALDTQKWDTSFLWGPYLPINNEHQIYIDKHGRHANSPLQPFTVDGGVLTITAEPLAADDVPEQPDLNDPEWQTYSSHQYNPNYGTSNGWTPSYSSGLLTTYDAFKFVNGYVEARMKLPEGGGMWPAFWLLNGYYVGPIPEIDIMELDGAHPNVAHQSYHYHDTNGQIQSSATQSSSSTGSFTDDFHTFGVQWDAEQIKWYIDGVVVRTLQGPEVSTQLMYILLNLAIGGNFVGEIDTTAFPAKLEVDYVRAYQRKDHAFYCNGLQATIVGSDGADNLVGTASADVIVAMGGDDTIEGAAGNDVICGGYGNDVVNGAAGNDTVFAGPGNDEVKGGPDNDTLYGQAGNDNLRGSRGDDVINGDAGDDLIDGGWGNDVIKGGPDNDTLLGNLGDDTIRGSRGDDSLDGGEGHDNLNGGWGDDFIKGGPGNDVVNGSLGNDSLRGSRGDDVLDGGQGDDVLNAGVHVNGDTCMVDANDTVPAANCE